MRNVVLVNLILFLASPAIAAASDDAVSNAQLKAAKEFPDFGWVDGTSLVTDVNDDGVPDVILVGMSGDSFRVALVVTTDDGPLLSSMLFLQSASAQAGTCGKPTGWIERARNEAPLNALGVYPEGYQHCEFCSEYVLIDDGNCDPVQVFWNTESEEIGWWRA